MARNRERSARGNARRRAEEHKKGGGNYVKRVKLPDGVKFLAVKDDTARRFDILGYDVTVEHNPWAEQGDFHFERTYFAHRIPDPMSDKNYQTQVICPKKTFGKACPICEFASTQEGEKAKELEPKERQLWNVVDRTDEEKGVQVWDQSYHLFGKKLDFEIQNADDDDGFDAFADWKGGMTLKVAFEEKKRGSNKFFDAASIQFKGRKEDYDSPAVVDLDTVLILYTYETLESLLNMEECDLVEDTTTGAGAPKEAPAEKKAPKAPKAPAKVEDDDEDAEEEDAEAKKKAAKAEARAKKAAEEAEEEAAEEAAIAAKAAKAKAKAAKEAAAKVKEEAEAEDDDDDAQEVEATTVEDDDAPAEDGGDECPCGKVYGVDNDKHDECTDCDVDLWGKCFAAQKLLKQK